MPKRKFPKASQWKQIFKILGPTEKKIFLGFAFLAVVSLAYLAGSFYVGATKKVPAYGGSYTEGIVGQPRFLNPIYGETNDVDRSLVGLIYSGLMTYDNQGKLANDLVDSYKISDDGKTYSFTLKDNLFWQDGMPLTSDDVVYTIKTIQNSDYKSPLRPNWINVGTNRLSDKVFEFTLQAPYNSFLENCTVKIIPQHIWKDVLPQNFTLSSYNLHPVGSGPYMFSGIAQTNTGFIKTLNLKANSKYFGKVPYISNLSFQFFSSKDEIIKAAGQKTIDGFSLASFDNNEVLAEKSIAQGFLPSNKFASYSFTLPRYFAVFFNPKNKMLADANVAQALNHATDKNDLIKQISDKSKEKISIVNSPILPDYYGFNQPTTDLSLDLDASAKLLDKAGFKDNGSGLREKPNDKKPAFQFKSYLKTGVSGKEVAELQTCLSKLDNNMKDILKNDTPGKYSVVTEKAVEEFQKKYMPDSKVTSEVGASTRKKLNELCFANQSNSTPLAFTLTTINQPELVQTANLLKDYWQKIGANVTVKVVELSELKDTIKQRNYDALLYGQALGAEPDLYPFWHSTQINDPGLNLAEFQNKNADQLLKEAREATDSAVKQQKYEKLQDIILQNSPAIFLYNPDYIYWISDKIKGIDTQKIVDPAKMFVNITNWYINTKRVLK